MPVKDDVRKENKGSSSSFRQRNTTVMYTVSEDREEQIEVVYSSLLYFFSLLYFGGLFYSPYASFNIFICQLSAFSQNVCLQRQTASLGKSHFFSFKLGVYHYNKILL